MSNVDAQVIARKPVKWEENLVSGKTYRPIPRETDLEIVLVIDSNAARVKDWGLPDGSAISLLAVREVGNTANLTSDKGCYVRHEDRYTVATPVRASVCVTPRGYLDMYNRAKTVSDVLDTKESIKGIFGISE